MLFTPSDPNVFKITIEIVPPAGASADALLDKLDSLTGLDFNAFSVASNPVAKPRMSAMAFCRVLSLHTGKPAILHLTIRDHNRLALQAELWGAKAPPPPPPPPPPPLGIETVIALSGDPSGKNTPEGTVTIKDLNVFQLIRMADDSGLETGAVLDFRPEVNGMAAEIRRIEKKAAAGCRFIVTQPVYDEQTAMAIKQGVAHIDVPVILGILPLISPAHANFLHDKVPGIAIPAPLRKEMAKASDALVPGINNAVQMLDLARKHFSGACVMPPFERFDIMNQIL